jgi:hypothetical protein
MIGFQPLPLRLLAGIPKRFVRVATKSVLGVATRAMFGYQRLLTEHLIKVDVGFVLASRSSQALMIWLQLILNLHCRLLAGTQAKQLLEVIKNLSGSAKKDTYS